MKEELGLEIPDNGYLMPWAQQGVLLLNAVLTVRSGEANSHKGKGWEKFTDAVIRAVAERPDPAVFVLWGNYAQKKLPLIDESRTSWSRARTLPAVGEEVLRLPPVHADRRGGRPAGPRAHRLDDPEPRLTRPPGRCRTAPARSRLTSIVSDGG